MPSLRTRVPDLENQVKVTDKRERIDGLEPAHRRDAAESEQSDSVIASLKDKDEAEKMVIVAQKKVNAANLQLDDKQRTIIMQWFMYGGGVLGVGLVLGLVLPTLSQAVNVKTAG